MVQPFPVYLLSDTVSLCPSFMAVPATGIMLVFSMFVAMAMAGAMWLFWLPLDRRLGCHQCTVVDRFIIDAVADVFLDIHQVVGKILACKTDGGAAGACACCSANTVDIIFAAFDDQKFHFYYARPSSLFRPVSGSMFWVSTHFSSV